MAIATDERTGGTMSPKDTKSKLTNDARLLLEACGVNRGGNWISRTVRDYLASPIVGLPFGVFLTARLELSAAKRRQLEQRADLRYLLTYSDPTGETAIRNIMRGNRHDHS